MEYSICEKTEDEYLKSTAGIKAREDLDAIFADCHIKPLFLPEKDKDRADGNAWQKFYCHLRKKKEFAACLSDVKPGDTVYIQFPVRNHTIFLAGLIRKLVKFGTKIVLFIHDLEAMRHIKEKNMSFQKRKRMELEEISALRAASYVVCHNAKMKKIMCDTLHIPEKKLIELHIFDYLISDKPMRRDRADMPYSCIIAGNLDRKKCGYVYHLPDDVDFHLYGPNYTGGESEHKRYYGSFPPSELPAKLEGDFGLVWDGSSVDTCAGVYGEYLRVNNPHKTSLYLASGIPVIIWKEAALAEFVEAQGVGITISSLQELHTRLERLSKDEYEQMLARVSVISDNLTSGYYTKKALEACR